MPKSSEFGNLLNTADAVFKVPHVEIKAKLEQEKRAKKWMTAKKSSASRVGA